MTAKIDGREMFKQKEIDESSNGENSFFCLTDQSDSEMRWVKLHYLFDR